MITTTIIIMIIIAINSYIMITNYDTDNDDKSNTQHKDNKE